MERTPGFFATLGVVALVGLATVLWVLGHAGDNDPWLLLPLACGLLSAVLAIGLVVEGEK